MDDDTHNLEQLEKVFGKVERTDAFYMVTASAKIFPDRIRYFVPLVPYEKKIPFMEQRIDDLDGKVEDWTTRVYQDSRYAEDNLARSIRRTKTLLSDYVMCNEFEHFVTFTFDSKKTKDRYNPDLLKIQMSDWLRNQRKRNGKFKYLIVPEFHKDRKAIHFHALFKDYQGELIDSGKKINGRKAYNLKGYKLGFSTLIKIDNSPKVANYIKKYITKDMPQFHNRHRFWASKGLATPPVIDNPCSITELGPPLSSITVKDYGYIFTFARFEGDEEVLAS